MSRQNSEELLSTKEAAYSLSPDSGVGGISQMTPEAKAKAEEECTRELEKIDEKSTKKTKTEIDDIMPFILQIIGTDHNMDQLHALLYNCSEDEPIFIIDWVNIECYVNAANHNLNLLQVLPPPVNNNTYTKEEFKTLLVNLLIQPLLPDVENWNGTDCVFKFKTTGNAMTFRSKMGVTAHKTWMKDLGRITGRLLARVFLLSDECFMEEMPPECNIW